MSSAATRAARRAALGGQPACSIHSRVSIQPWGWRRRRGCSPFGAWPSPSSRLSATAGRIPLGALPTSLDTLVPGLLFAVPQDPFSGLPLAYRPAADGYAIYSVDVNRRDDGGAFYGHGAAVTKFVAAGAPRDFGIRVPLTRSDNRSQRVSSCP